MMRQARMAGWTLASAILVAAVGCQSGGDSKFQTSTASLVEDLKPFQPEARLARMQRGDGPPVSPPPGLPTAAEQKAMVRAYVNGNAIFDHEVLNLAVPRIRAVGKIERTEMVEMQATVYNDSLQDLIDQEVVYQEAVRRLEKNNAPALKKLKEVAEQETDKKIDQILKSGQKIPPEVLREQLPMMRRYVERNLVFTEYLRSRIKPLLDSRIGLVEIRDYYEAHKNEYVRVDEVDWQDVFIAVGPKHPTLADARKFAEELIARVRTAEDFAKLVPFDEGDSKFRGGKGFGKRRGEIRPAELEEYLFKMRDGEIGPVIELSTGVHIFRLVKREMGGQIPLTEDIQKKIRNQLQGQLFEKEARRIIRELRARSVIEIESR